MTEAELFVQNYCDFSNPNWVWILTGISRNKDKTPTDSGVKFMRRMIIANPDDVLSCYEDIKKMADNPNTVYRMYISLNARDVVNTLFNFQKKILNVGMGLAKNQPDALELSKKISSVWKRELAQTNNRGTKRILLDIDDNDVEKFVCIEDFVLKMDTEVITCRKTVNGYHLIFNACDTRALMIYCKEIGVDANLQRDSMVFVEQWRGNNA